MSGIDHVGLSVADIDRSVAFYTAALGALGIRPLTDFIQDGKRQVRYGAGDEAVFWLGAGTRSGGQMQIAFTAKSRAEIDAFYAIALSAGGRDHDRPGLRPYVHPACYGAAVFDPDGNIVEAVHHGG